MSAEIAEELGKAPSIKTAPARCPPDSGISGLAAYLATEGAKTLEQEELDPALPEPSDAHNLASRRVIRLRPQTLRDRSLGPRFTPRTWNYRDEVI
jgi:hypothetical protein